MIHSNKNIVYAFEIIYTKKKKNKKQRNCTLLNFELILNCIVLITTSNQYTIHF